MVRRIAACGLFSAVCIQVEVHRPADAQPCWCEHVICAACAACVHRPPPSGCPESIGDGLVSVVHHQRRCADRALIPTIRPGETWKRGVSVSIIGVGIAVPRAISTPWLHILAGPQGMSTVHDSVAAQVGDSMRHTLEQGDVYEKGVHAIRAIASRYGCEGHDKCNFYSLRK